jgi:hypothetical protein
MAKILNLKEQKQLKWDGYCIKFNPFQSNFSANRILPSSYLFIHAIFLQAQPCEYNAQSPVHIKTHGLSRNRKSTTCAICWPKSVLHEEKRQTGSDSGAGATKTCRTSSDIGAEQENHNVGRGPTQDQKGLKDDTFITLLPERKLPTIFFT